MKSKILAVLVALSVSFQMTGFSQVFFQSMKDKDFKHLISNGVYYVMENDSQLNEAVINEFNANWNACDFKPISIEEFSTLKNNELVFFLTTMTTINNGYRVSEKLWAITAAQFLNGKRKLNKYNLLCYMPLNGFNQRRDSAALFTYLPLYISGISDGIEIIHRNNIRLFRKINYRLISRNIGKRSKILKEKTLLIVLETSGYVRTDLLEKYGIKYQIITQEQFNSFTETELENYCLLFFGYNSFTDVSIFDLQDNSLIYNWHSIYAKSEFGRKDIKKIIKNF